MFCPPIECTILNIMSLTVTIHLIKLDSSIVGTRQHYHCFVPLKKKYKSFVLFMYKIMNPTNYSPLH